MRKIGNHEVDKFIQKSQLKVKNSDEILEWIEYDRFENVKYLTKGGFATIYKAIWKDGYIKSWDSKNNQWKRSKYWCKGYENYPVVLRCLHNSHDITAEFLREIELHTMLGSGENRVNPCYGITKDPKSNNFMIVMPYAENETAEGLNNIHKKGLIHHDLHCGNILNSESFTFITDLGLSQPANAKPSEDEYEKIYGVLPYVAPEVLGGKTYTKESDIYGFGIIAYEICAGLPPYHDIAHDEFLAIRICLGLRPKSDYKIPQLILDIIKRCWDADPLKRPKADELYGLLYKIYLSNPQAIYTSRLLDFKNLPEPKNAIDNKDNDNSLEEYSESLKMDFTKLIP
ncbi:hypothetical protein RclHR1_03100016 [Rhizophagus clarus]|uniref:Protein kinase domain-containing protein n=1 Tax=Rhizophagus clarus TaxID=94130 RepID=A0A2Z6RIQ9_9GLOM|nr:hypothetical protein RclHR1_03100016 [Rhizophagus clarus]